MNEQQLQEQLASLKIRLFDAGEQLENARQTITQLQQFLTHVAQAARVAPDEQGNIALESILAAIQGAFPETDVCEDAEPAGQELLVE